MNPYPPAMAPDRWLPPGLMRTIRATTMRWGLASAVLGLLMIIAMPVFGYLLPTSYDVTTVVTVGLGSLASAFLLLSGIGMLIARSYVATGYLRYRKEYLAIGIQLGTVIPGWLVTIAFVLWYIVVVTTSGNYIGQEQLHFTVPIVLYLLLPVVAMLINSINLIIVFSLFFPSPRRLSRYSSRAA
ncbi:hypothetical protein [Amycolatopsis circi]|uniref:hypothetical protein n=1 Tax=Amycolatopsis circi TaxID=871959 RepID=UPI001ABFD2D9|nr:hypothetical protein [Amycolatopsis circi]